MANECHEDDNELQVKPIHFKIILTNNLLEGKLMIPRMFVEKYGEGLPKTVFLKPPNGVAWKVNLIKHDGEIWFQKGWKEFAEYHSLAEGHIVVFRYERTSKFQVLIFDMSALEIDYPFKRVEGKRASNVQGNKPPMVERFEDKRPSQKREDKSSLEFLQQLKKRNTRCVEVETISNLSKATLHYSGKKCKEGPQTSVKQITALERARSFKSLNPSCLVVMYPSYLHSQANLNLPVMFGKKYFDLSIKRGDINLCLANGRVWHARYLIRETYNGTKFELSTSGWKPFAKDNNLKVGDVCTFELIDRTKFTFQVHIFRENGNSNCSTSQEKPMIAAKQITALDRASSPCNPSVQVVMHPSYVRSHAKLNLPAEFCKEHFDLGEKLGDINLQLLNGRVWPARYAVTKDCTRTRFHLTRGWEEFANENDLKVGDVCTFELIERTKLTFQVYIIRESDNSRCVTPQESAQNHRSPIQVYRRNEKRNNESLGNELGNRLNSNRIDTWQQEIREDKAVIMNGMECCLGCNCVIIWLVLGWLIPQGRESIALLIFSFFVLHLYFLTFSFVSLSRTQRVMKIMTTTTLSLPSKNFSSFVGQRNHVTGSSVC